MEENSQETTETGTAQTEEKPAVEKSATPPPTTEQTASANESEYETLDEAYSSSEHDEEKVEQQELQNDTGSESGEHSGSESESDIGLERQEGDGQESTPNKKVDDDEDKRNPQYIPKRGTFYEHDDRTAVEENSEAVDETVETERQDKESKKKVWQEKESTKWNHDRYNDSEQAPKSRSELIAIYGYDIRNEEGPPRARRRRRYGRGPNKYTRNWEDEDAYNKPPAAQIVRKPRRKDKDEEFPPLTGGDRNNDDDGEYEEDYENSEPAGPTNTDILNKSKIESKPLIKPEQQYYQNKQQHQQQQQSSPKQNVEINENQLIKRSSFNKSQQQTSPSQLHQQQPPPQQYHQRERIIGKSKPPRPFPDNDAYSHPKSETKGFTKSFQFRDNSKSSPQTTRASPGNRKPKEIINSQNYTNKNLNQQKAHDMEKDMAKMSIQDGTGYKGSKYNNQRQASVPPRMQAEQKTSKRYSSLRQRSLPETAAPPFNQHSNYYPNEFSQQNAPNQQQPPPPPQQGMLQHPHGQMAQNAPPQMSIASSPIGPPANAAPMMQAPPQFAPPPFPQPPPAAFLQPGVAPPPFIPQQPPPQMINYAQPQYSQPAFAGYQHQPQFSTPPHPPELYQPQGGITYYSTQNQQVVQRAPLKRPKAAIPIVPPPESSSRNNRDRSSEDQVASEGNDGGNNFEESNPAVAAASVQQ